DGSDQLYGVETLRFEDGDIAVSMSNGEFQVNTYTTGDQQKLQPASYVAALSDGGFVVTWESQGQDGDGYGVYAQRYDSSGNAAGDEFQVNTYATNDQKYPSVAALSDGGFVVAWTSDGQDGSGHGIYAQRYDASGNAEGSEFQVNSNAAIKQEVPSVAKLLDGGFVVTWHSWPDQDGSLYAVHGQRYDADGTAIGGEFLVNTHTASSQVNSFVAALSDGGFVVTWASYKQDGSLYGIYGQRYKEDGTKDGDEFQINTHTALNQDYPYVAALPDGGFVVTWMSEQKYGGGNNVYAQIYDSSGNAVGSEFQINTYTSGNQVTSTVAVLSDGGFVVAWGSQGQDGSGMGIFAQRFDADGNPVGPVTFTGTSGDDTINGGSGSETIVGGAGDDTISGGPGDDVAEFAGRMADYTIGQVGTGVEVSDTDPVRDGNDGTDQLDGVETLSFADGELTLSMAGGEIQVNTYTAGNQLTPRVAGLSDGGSIVTWQSAGQDGSGLGVYAQRFDAAGNPVGPEFLVNETTSQEQQAPDVTALADGGFVIAWQSGTSLSDDIFGQRYDASGEAVGSEFRINTYTSGDQDLGSLVGLCEGGFVVVWISMGQDGSNWGVYGQRYDASGETAGSEFQINTFTTGEQVGAKVAALADGGFVVTWSSPGQDGDQRGVYGQRYDGNGNKDGSEFQVNTTTAGDQVPGTVAALSDGGFVVAWYASGQDGSGWGIFGQRFDASGTAAGSEFQVNTYTSGDQLNPKVAGLADGGFVVTWQSNGQDGSSWGIFGQRFDADGNEDGAEFQVNTFTAGNQGAAWVDGLADGGFMVTWYSTGQDGSGDGVYAQRFDPEGNPLGPLTITGGDGDDTITAGSGSETLIGGDGNDTLTGGSTGQDLLAGGDVLIGGTGDDVLAIDGAVAGLDGGAGNDTLRLAGSGQTLDLTGHGGDEVSGIENVDLGGQGNTLTLTMADVLDISDTTDQLLVDGGADDSVSAPGEGWTNQGTTVVEGNTYTIYTNGSASLLVDTDIGNQIVN
ncbi:MAG TPA: hypothetical protein QF861_08995, partial [Alphaproteobacteria bacterium]|nr:hypothetical protein [Alphaproteobacteria bacterium]